MSRAPAPGPQPRAPRLAISMGDPTGIGPEVTLRALARRRGYRPILVGDAGVYSDTARRLGVSASFPTWPANDSALPRRGVVLREVCHLRERERRPGRPGLAGGKAAYAAILEALRLVQCGAADAMVTAPICKENLLAAGMPEAGHTELLARLSGTAPVRMMMVGRELRVMLVTTHVAIARVPGLLTREGVLETILLCDRTLRRWFGLAAPRIAVSGLNPHAGEGGMFGDEEERVIGPAVRGARRRRVDAVGPLAADGTFALAARGRWDAVVCMYHDQGLAPFKLRHFRDGVNLTTGLPFVRTSPDHGTAHDIAGKGEADPSSMRAALTLAARLARASRDSRVT